MYYSVSRGNLRSNAFTYSSSFLVSTFSYEIVLTLKELSWSILYQTSNYQVMQELFMMYWIVILNCFIIEYSSDENFKALFYIMSVENEGV